MVALLKAGAHDHSNFCKINHQEESRKPQEIKMNKDWRVQGDRKLETGSGSETFLGSANSCSSLQAAVI